MNSINIIGRVGKDPELKYFDSGKCKGSFSVAVDRGRKDKDGNKQTDWFTVEVWNKQAEFVGEYVRKGDRIGVSGKMENDRYEKDGQQRDFWKLQADRLDLLGGKKDGQGGEDEQIPF